MLFTELKNLKGFQGMTSRARDVHVCPPPIFIENPIKFCERMLTS